MSKFSSIKFACRGTSSTSEDELAGVISPSLTFFSNGFLNNAENGKGRKKCVIKRRLKFNDYKDCILNKEIVLKSQQRFKSERHDVYTEEIIRLH